MRNESFKWLRNLFLAIVLTTVTVAGLPLTGGPVAALAADKDIVVLYTNDVHCGVGDSIGYAGPALYKKEMQQQTPYVTLVDTGGAIQGAPIGALSDGGYLIDIMDYVGCDFAIPRNHEFDYGMSRFLALAGKLNCGYYSYDLIDSATGAPVFAPYKIFTYRAAQVAFVGVATPENFTKSTPAYSQGSQGNYIYSFYEDESDRKLYDQAQASVDTARTTGADYVILAGHLREDGTTQKWSSASVITNTTGIGTCINGHSHETVPSENVENKSGQNVVLTQTGTKLNHIGKLTISADGSIRIELMSEVPAADLDREYTVQEHDSLSRIAKRELSSCNRWIDIYDNNLDKIENADVIPMGLNVVIPGKGYINSDGKAADCGTYQFIQSIENQYNKTLKAVPGTTPYELIVSGPAMGNHAIGNIETNLGDLTADAYRVELGADIGLGNGGGIRSIVKPGSITYNDTLAVFPYGNMGCVIGAAKQQIRDALEMAFRNCPEESNGFLQVSGLTYAIDTSVRSDVQTGDKGDSTDVSGAYRIMDTKVGGEPIDPKKTYTVVSHNYILEQEGDGITMFKGCSIIRDEVMVDVDVLSSYIRRVGGFVTSEYTNPGGQGRISIR